MSWGLCAQHHKGSDAGTMRVFYCTEASDMESWWGLAPWDSGVHIMRASGDTFFPSSDPDEGQGRGNKDSIGVADLQLWSSEVSLSTYPKDSELDSRQQS